LLVLLLQNEEAKMFFTLNKIVQCIAYVAKRRQYN